MKHEPMRKREIAREEIRREEGMMDGQFSKLTGSNIDYALEMCTPTGVLRNCISVWDKRHLVCEKFMRIPRSNIKKHTSSHFSSN